MFLIIDAIISCILALSKESFDLSSSFNTFCKSKPCVSFKFLNNGSIKLLILPSSTSFFDCIFCKSLLTAFNVFNSSFSLLSLLSSILLKPLWINLFMSLDTFNFGSLVLFSVFWEPACLPAAFSSKVETWRFFATDWFWLAIDELITTKKADRSAEADDISILLM